MCFVVFPDNSADVDVVAESPRDAMKHHLDVLKHKWHELVSRTNCQCRFIYLNR